MLRPRKKQDGDTPGKPDLDLGPLPELIGYVLRRAQMRVFKDFIETCSEVDARPGQFSALTLIDRNPGARQSEIGKALGVNRPNTVKLINDLESRGLARRVPHATDRRSRALVLTEDGEALLDRLNGLVRSHEQRLIESVGADGRDLLINLLYRLGNDPACGEEEDA